MTKPSVDSEHTRPPGVSDQTVAAVGKVSEALELVERIRGRLYDVHQMTGRADNLFSEAAQMLRKAGHDDTAKTLQNEIIGLNLLPGCWTFQIIEAFNGGYYKKVTDFEEAVRQQLMHGKRHVFEAEMKEANRTKNKHGHEATAKEL